MREPRKVMDVSRLPTVSFGHHDVNWWATLAFIVIEGTTLAVAIAAYFYLRKNFHLWPPELTPQPDLLIPTLNTILLLGVIAPMAWVDRAAKRMELDKVRIGLLIGLALTLVCTVLRFWEFQALNTRWDSDAYGSIAWGVLVLHTTLLAVDLLETGVLAVLSYIGPLQPKHFSDFSDAAFYQYFLSLSGVVVYVVLFWSPRWF